MAAQTLGLERLEAQWLLLHALGKPADARAWLLAHDTDELSDDVAQRFCQLCVRRANGAPLADIVGTLQSAGCETRILAVDASLGALAVAEENAKQLGLKVDFLQSNWLQAVTGSFELIVSNPPYIAQADPHLAALAHEPIEALTAGTDGLDDIRQIIAQAGAHLHSGGWLLLEHGYDQAARVRELLLRQGFSQVQSRQDLAGIERCSGGQWLRSNAALSA